MANAITRWTTWLYGERVGEDSQGNIYYQSKSASSGGRRRRWVVYAKGGDEASRVPPEFHAWLHYTADELPAKDAGVRYAWQQEHEANQTGAPGAYRPPGHTLRGGARDKATGDYEAWTPE